MAVPARSQWVVGAERVVDENRHVRLSTVDVTLPDGTEFTQYVVRMPRCAMTLVLDDDQRVLLMYRHRFVIDRWVWELPGGYIDGGRGHRRSGGSGGRGRDGVAASGDGALGDVSAGSGDA